MRFLRQIAAAIVVGALLAFLAPAAAGAGEVSPPATGYVQVNSSPAGATVFVNQAQMNGTTPLTLRVPASQPQEVLVNLYGYEAERQTVSVQPNQTALLEFELQLLPGGGQLETETPGAARSPTAPPGEPQATLTTAVAAEAPVPASLALLALVGAGLLLRQRR